MNAPDSNVSDTEERAVAAPPTAAVATSKSLSRTMVTLIRRELWEHRALWMAPGIIAVLLVACAIPAHVGSLDLDTDAPDFIGNRLAVFGLVQWLLSLPQYLVMAIVLSFYLLDCLYAERRDRSILFWKSLPVSDATTVVSKLLTGLVVVPLGVYLIAMAASLLVAAICLARVSFGLLPAAFGVWDSVVWLKVEALMLSGLVVSILWYAPMAAYLVLVSAWARRSVFLWATLPPVFAIVVERVAFGTNYVMDLIDYRSWGIWKTQYLENVISGAFVGSGPHRLVSLPRVFDTIDLRLFFGNVDLWLGLLVTVGFVFAAVRIRRYRDDT